MSWVMLGLIPILVSCAIGSNPSTDSKSTTTEGPLTTEASLAPTSTATKIEDPASLEPLWQQTIASLGSSLINGGVGVSNEKIFGVMADSYTGTVSIWSWETDQFVAASELAVEDSWNGDFWGIDTVRIVDLNGDSSDDIFVDYHLNDFVAKAFSQISGSWNALTFDGNSVLTDPSLSGSEITGFELTCLPSCAEGPAIPLTYSWNGSEFNGSAVDAFGNTFTMTVIQSCSNFRQTESEPYKLCDRGEGIRYLQQVLYDNGGLLILSDNPIDGYFGAATEYSIKAYQFANNIPVTGTVEGQWYHDLIEGYNLANGFGD